MTALRTWILAGQSNMEGVGLLGDADAAIDPLILSFSSAGRWTIAEEPLHRHDVSFTSVNRRIAERHRAEAVERGAAGLPPGGRAPEADVVGAGLGLPFAREVRRRTGDEVGLIPAAHGGTSLDEWSPAPPGGDTLYGAMLERVRRAGEARELRLEGLLWYQGESDASDRANAESYALRFDAWVRAVRRDLGVPELPVHVVQLARVIDRGSGNHAWWDLIREAQRTVSYRTEATSCVAALDLPLSDPIHVATRGLERLGRRLAHVALGGTELQPAALLPGRHTRQGFPTARLLCSGVHDGWRGAARIDGFGLYRADGSPHPRFGVIDVVPVRDDPGALDLIFSGMDAEVRVGYGLGADGVGTLVDGADLALPAFGPWPVGHRAL